MFARPDAIAALAAAEFRSAVRGRVVQWFGALFAVLAIGVAVAGLGASGQLLVQGFGRTAVSLLTLALYLLPLVGLALGASTFGAEDGGTELLLAQPVPREVVLTGRAAGLALAMLAVAAAGFGSAAVIVAVFAGTAGLGAYAAMVLGAVLVGLAGLSLGVMLGVLARRRAAAVGMALAAWLAIAVVYDLIAIAVLQLFGSGEPGPLLLGLLALNPVDGVRALGLTALGADVLLGPTGAAMQRLMGPGGGAAVVGASVLVCLAAPMAIAARVYRARDF
jgi:Cu-processing system permease protein